jgi:hypothetical protein
MLMVWLVKLDRRDLIRTRLRVAEQPPDQRGFAVVDATVDRTRSFSSFCLRKLSMSVEGRSKAAAIRNSLALLTP